MEKMNHAFEKVKILVGMEVDDDQNVSAQPEEGTFSFMDDFNRDCTLSTKQVRLAVEKAKEIQSWFALYSSFYPAFLE